jgi:hypothetical protein
MTRSPRSTALSLVATVLLSTALIAPAGVAHAEPSPGAPTAPPEPTATLPADGRADAEAGSEAANGEARPDAAVAPTSGGIEPVLLDPATLAAGTVTDVSTALRTTTARADLVGTITFTAPSGSTFAPQETAPGWWRPGSTGSWRPEPALRLTDGQLSSDGRQLVFRHDTTARAEGLTAGATFRFDVLVTTPASAVPGQSELTWTISGTSTGTGPYTAEGATYTTTTALPSPALTLTSPARVADGYTADAPFRFAGLGRPGALVVVSNSKGLELGRARVDLADGTWSWTRHDMGSAEWSLVFVQDAGTPQQREVRLLGFVPNPGVDLVLLSPDAAEQQRGYQRGAAWTFRGTGRPGAVVAATNLAGFRLGQTEVRRDGTWEWTRDDMGSYVWSIRFVQDEGSYRPRTVTLNRFAPAVEQIRLTTPDAAQIREGYQPNAPFTFAGTGRPGALVRAQNAKGFLLGWAQVDRDGDWSWELGNMRSYVWSIDFVQDAGTADEKKAALRGFAPRS